MKRIMKKILILAVSVVLALSINVTAFAQMGGILGNFDLGAGGTLDEIRDIIDKFVNPTTTSPDNNNTTQVPDETTTADPNAPTTDPVNSSGSGSITTTEPTRQDNQNNYTPNGGGNTYTPVTPVVTEPSGDEEEPGTSFDSSLLEWLEQDSAAIIVQTPSEQFTIGSGLVVNNGEQDDDISWQQIALIAAAVLFVILAALVVALLVQKSKKTAEKETGSVTLSDSDVPSGPVPVEIMSEARIAELLGSARAGGRVGTPEEEAAILRKALLMGQLTHTYSDPLIRKYTDEPVRMSPLAGLNENGDVSASQILEATDSMLDDITGNEKYASDTSGVTFLDGDLESLIEETETKTCPECGAPVQSSDVFCHSCGAYVG